MVGIDFILLIIKIKSMTYTKLMAERKGFEPLRGVNPNTLSRRAP